MREKLASLQHDIWTYWMEYLFSTTVEYPSGAVLITHKNVMRWRKQMKKTYDELSEEEKESDRHQADKVIALIKRTG